MWRIPFLILLAMLLNPDPVTAQLCAGVQSFTGRPFMVHGFGTLNPNTHLSSYGGAIRLTGGNAAFGDVDVGGFHSDDLGGFAWSLGGGAAYRVPLNKTGTLELCPGAGLGFVLGPKNIFGSSVDYSETDLSAGASIGVLASHSARLDLVPTASIDFIRATQRLKDDTTGATNSATTTFEVIDLGLGLVHRQQLTLKPSLAIPVGLSGATVHFTLALIYTLGAPR